MVKSASGWETSQLRTTPVDNVSEPSNSCPPATSALSPKSTEREHVVGKRARSGRTWRNIANPRMSYDAFIQEKVTTTRHHKAILRLWEFQPKTRFSTSRSQSESVLRAALRPRSLEERIKERSCARKKTSSSRKEKRTEERKRENEKQSPCRRRALSQPRRRRRSSSSPSSSCSRPPLPRPSPPPLPPSTPSPCSPPVHGDSFFLIRITFLLREREREREKTKMRREPTRSREEKLAFFSLHFSLPLYHHPLVLPLSSSLPHLWFSFTQHQQNSSFEQKPKKKVHRALAEGGQRPAPGRECQLLGHAAGRGRGDPAPRRRHARGPRRLPGRALLQVRGKGFCSTFFFLASFSSSRPLPPACALTRRKTLSLSLSLFPSLSLSPSLPLSLSLSLSLSSFVSYTATGLIFDSVSDFQIPPMVAGTNPYATRGAAPGAPYSLRLVEANGTQAAAATAAGETVLLVPKPAGSVIYRIYGADPGTNETGKVFCVCFWVCFGCVWEKERDERERERERKLIARERERERDLERFSFAPSSSTPSTFSPSLSPSFLSFSFSGSLSLSLSLPLPCLPKLPTKKKKKNRRPAAAFFRLDHDRSSPHFQLQRFLPFGCSLPRREQDDPALRSQQGGRRPGDGTHRHRRRPHRDAGAPLCPAAAAALRPDKLLGGQPLFRQP